MLVMKLEDSKKRVRVYELLKAGHVQFDPRPDWLLVTPDIGKRGRKVDLFWVHSSDIKVEWVREFLF